MMGRVPIAAAIALALFASAGRAQTPSETASTHSRELAQAIVAIEGGRARLARLSMVEPILTAQIENALKVEDGAKKDRIGIIVHNRYQALLDELVQARVEALAQTFNAEELEGHLAFANSPTGQALRRAGPELSRELGSAMGTDAVIADIATLPAHKLALIDRILTGRGVENSARKGRRVLNTVFASALSGDSKTAASAVAPNDEAAQEDAFAKRAYAAEAQFYAKTFSDEQLTDLANYFDGPIGRKFAERVPRLAMAGASAGANIFKRQFGLLDNDVCEVVGCNATQRAALDDQLKMILSMIGTTMNTFAH